MSAFMGMEDAVRIEQAQLHRALARREALLQEIGETLDKSELDGHPTRRRDLLRQQNALVGSEEGLIFGRLDTLEGETLHIGRLGLPAEDDASSRVVVDWRAPAARAFYTATPLNPEGQARRRHIRMRGAEVVSVSDETLDARSSLPIVAGGDATLMAVLEERRSGHMSTAASTLQAEQDAIVRAEPRRALVVQGGPGTGKTVVALHRAAYVLFSDPRATHRGVLTIGPSRRFLDYIAQVLPALGETAVVASTIDTLIPGVTVQRIESREAAELKGRNIWRAALTRYVRGLRPQREAMTLSWEGERYGVTARTVGRFLDAVDDNDSYHVAGAVFRDQLTAWLCDAVVERADEVYASVDDDLRSSDKRFLRSFASVDDDSAPDEGPVIDVDQLRATMTADRTLQRALTAVWPHRNAEDLYRRLLDSDAALQEWVPELTTQERELILQQPDEIAPSDIALLDTLWDLLGDTTGASTPDAGFVAERAAQDRGWVYGHVVVDEAQELSPMQWHMVSRRTAGQAVTAVGDIDQTESPHDHTSWEAVIGDAFGSRWSQRELTIGYRTPAEVMALTPPVLGAMGSRSNPPRAVRSSGVIPWRQQTSAGELPGCVADAVAAMAARWVGGSIGVVTADAHLDSLTAAVGDRADVLTAGEAKGLEWDAVVVVDPDRITQAPRGWNALYVALTRCTQELGQIIIVGDEVAAR